MTVRIITDSAADISPERVAAWNVGIIPLKTIVNGIEYKDGVTLTSEEFFELLPEAKVLPTTSAIAPGEYEQVMRAELEAGNEVVIICLSSKLSACYQSALIAQECVSDDRVCVVDSLNATLGQQILVERAVQLRDQGLSAAEIAASLENAKKHIRLVAVVDTLEYLCKGGRVSSTAAFVGELLSIKPVIAVEDGEVVVLGKARGVKNGKNHLVEKSREAGGIDYSKPYLTAYSGNSDKLYKNYLADCAVHFPVNIEDIPVCKIGSTIGVHVGPNAVGVAFYSREA